MERVNLWVVLTEDTMRQISASLDVKSMIRCKLVCKKWRNLISDLISDNPLAPKHDLQFLVPFRFGDTGTDQIAPFRFGVLDYETETDQIAWMKTLHLESATRFDSIKSPRVTSSCNGLVCFVDRDLQIFICNPIIGDYISFPRPKDRDKDYVHGDIIPPVDLGFCPSSNEYKLTTFTREPTLEICTLRTPIRWRSVPLFEVEGLCGRWSPAICVGHVFHWLLKTPSVSNQWTFQARSILTFDLAKEAFGSIPSPPLEGRKDIYHLECMDHCLLVTAWDNPSSYLDIWVRKQDKSSGESVWTKDLIIGAPQSLDPPRPQKLSSDGLVFLTCLDPRVCSYDVRHKIVTSRYFLCKELLAYYTPTFVSPKMLIQNGDG